MDVSNYIKQQKSTNHHQNGNIHSNDGSTNGYGYITNEDMKKKAASLDSINAVERELDEVLKDLELNSQDLNEQLNENSVELPINIQNNSVKIESSSSSTNSCSSPSISINKSNSSIKWTPNNNNENNNFLDKQQKPIKQNQMLGSEFINHVTNNNLYIDDKNLYSPNPNLNHNNKFQLKSNEEINKKLSNSNNNGQRKRQNIISTYELCHECFDSSLIISNNDGSQQFVNKCCKNHKPNNGYSDFTNLSYTATKSTSNLPNQSNLQKFTPSHSNQDLAQNQTYFNHFDQNQYPNRSKSILTQINESLVSDSSISMNKPLSKLRSNNNNNTPKSMNGLNSSSSNDLKSQNGNVISQKIITIGMPIRGGDQSPSPKPPDNRSKSIPINKINNNDDKLDKLPPVPPSAWINNSNARRRNIGYQPPPQQTYLNGSTRLKRIPNGKPPTGQLINEQYDTSAHYTVVYSGDNEHILNGTSNKLNNVILNELSIQESGTSSFEEDESNSSIKNESKNYDNFNLENGDSDERVEITINKDQRYKDFGFSISDNVYGKGIFVNKIRMGSPAEQNNFLKPFTQIFKVNFSDI